MSIKMRIWIILFAVSLIFVVVYLIRKNKINLKYSLVWLVLGTSIALTAIFPKILGLVNRFVGFALTSNMVFALAIGMLLIISLSLTVIVSTQATRSRLLIQEISMLKERVKELENEKK